MSQIIYNVQVVEPRLRRVVVQSPFYRENAIDVGPPSMRSPNNLQAKGRHLPSR